MLQGVTSNYDSDLFQPLLGDIAERVKKHYGTEEDADISMRVIADHLRSSTFLLADGVTPSNEGRGYVLRRILRRAIRHGKKLGQEKPFLHELVGSVCQSLGAFYPEIITNQKMVETLLEEEEEKFHETLDRGMGLLEENIQQLKRNKKGLLPGDIAFKLYDTFGFPLDLVEVICREHHLRIDHAGFELLMDKQRSLSTFNKGGDTLFLETIAKTLESQKPKTLFLGYDRLESDAKLTHLFSKDGKEVPFLPAGENGFAIFDQTPFYSESGGQAGDRGAISGETTKASVNSTTKVAKIPLHHVSVIAGTLESGKSWHLSVNKVTRKLTAINHTATHLLHAALRKILGERVKQAGSLVDPERLRFDFTFPRALSDDEIESIEQRVNAEARHALEIRTEEMDYDRAIQSGALAFFDEKYGDKVRVVFVGTGPSPFSIELCGGTHLKNTADIGLFKIVTETPSPAASAVSKRLPRIPRLIIFRNETVFFRRWKTGWGSRGRMSWTNSTRFFPRTSSCCGRWKISG